MSNLAILIIFIIAIGLIYGISYMLFVIEYLFREIKKDYTNYVKSGKFYEDLIKDIIRHITKK